ncbi:hypothetical protein RvY_17883 [Ramazzottius varieornatus]|uniref:Uncharacterized protein n=1 Tax=Ramazzottius varieornatus TaxID=947166 RepID=A0A1D1W3T2_RAMVA|nr:hypothetical protein RvY_17883 [Ramazzottius varieornatus]
MALLRSDAAGAMENEGKHIHPSAECLPQENDGADDVGRKALREEQGLAQQHASKLERMVDRHGEIDRTASLTASSPDLPSPLTPRGIYRTIRMNA